MTGGSTKAQEALDAVKWTLEALRPGTPVADEYQTRLSRLRGLVGMLAQSAEFGANAMRRMDNASRYFESSEFGAAAWELHMLQRQLASIPPRQPVALLLVENTSNG